MKKMYKYPVFLLLGLLIFLTTCDNPMGFGDPIDWEPPALTLEGANTRYVRDGVVLRGTVTDNGQMDRVVLIDSVTETVLATASLLPGDRWEISLNIGSWLARGLYKDGEKVVAVLVAYDRFGNSGVTETHTSIVPINLIIDNQKPTIDEAWVQRTITKRAELEKTLKTLTDLENLGVLDPNGDPNGDKVEHANKYQNGMFWIRARISETETRIKDQSIIVRIYDTQDQNTPLLSLNDSFRQETLESKTLNNYAPSWVVKESDILTAGENKYGSSYRTLYENGKRFYYRVDIEVMDLSENHRVEEQGYFCMWATADKPRGVIDPFVIGQQTGVINIVRGQTIPVIFFDDDQLESAYTGLIRKSVWDAVAADDDARLNYYATRLLNGITVNDWNNKPIANNGGTVDEKTVYVKAGEGASDYGSFVLVTAVRDNKLAPHTAGYERAVSSRYYHINIIDENAPLIVFDKKPETPNDPTIKGLGCPEENTFPALVNGKDFIIKGYTLREASNSANRVTIFRMAWIPYGVNGNKPHELVTAVQTALDTWETTALIAQGVKFWDLTLTDDGYEYISASEGPDVPYRRQRFSKQFDILEDFKYNGVLENESKLFIFYAKDSMENKVYSQLPLLGEKKPPNLKVYDITGFEGLTALSPSPTQTANGYNPVTMGLPDINKFISHYNPTGGVINDTVRSAYNTALNSYQSVGYGIISGVLGADPSDTDLARPMQAYPKGTTLKYWVTAESSGSLQVTGISMQDITYNETPAKAMHYDPSARKGSFTETLPEVTQRTYLFTATDTLGNEARAQRTIVITNASILREITTKTQEGTYGITEYTGQTITLEARFSSNIYWTGTNPPELNIRHNTGASISPTGAVTAGTTQVRSIPTKTPKNTPTLVLEFDVPVLPGYWGDLETMWNGIGGVQGGAAQNRPIRLPAETKILDYERNDDAFIPGYNPGFDWTDDSGSIQKTKKITLDGVRPAVSSNLIVSGKDPYESAIYYFKSEEKIGFTLNANKQIGASGAGNPRISFYIERHAAQGGGTSGPYYANYQRSAAGGQGLYFEIDVGDAAGIPVAANGTITNITLNTASGTISDSVGNLLAGLPAAINFSLVNNLNAAATVRVDQTKPNIPQVTLNNSTTIPANNLYRENPILNIPAAASANEPWDVAGTEYSLNNGLTWVKWNEVMNTSDNKWTSLHADGIRLYVLSGTWIMQTRYIDKAGNIGDPSSHTFSVNAKFPDLKSISAVQTAGTYRAGTTLTFDLVFSAPVWTQTAANVTITLKNRSGSNTHNDGGGTIPNTLGDESYTKTLTATPVAQASAKDTITFVWSGIADKEMLDGLYVSAVNFEGLRDVYGNPGSTGAAPAVIPYTLTIDIPGFATQTCANFNGASYIVDAIPPRVVDMTPKNAADLTGAAQAPAVSADNKTIKLVFSEPVIPGTGTITIKPHGNYYIPPVFENDTYYLNTATGARSSYPQAGYTKITGFNDLYNNAALNATDRGYLALGTDLGSGITLDQRTGQSAGPYVRMTHGLKEGNGYTGDYRNNQADTGFNYNTFNGPNPVQSGAMVPDVSLKWVLDYRYSINNGANTTYVNTSNVVTAADTTAVTNIRNTLTKAKYRWQELDVKLSSQQDSSDITGKTILITLNEPLEKGLQWDICFTEGAFTDKAGNLAPGENYTSGTIVGHTGSTRWFWSGGVQTPVIRVNRKSYDGRNANWATDYNTHTDPTRQTGTNGANEPGGWSMANFEKVHYRIESETPNAILYYRAIEGNSTNGSIRVTNAAFATGTWANDTTWGVAVPGGGGTNLTATNWNENSGTRGSWVRPNLIRRGTGSGTDNYFVSENGFTTQRNMSSVNRAYRGFRSYNRDALKTELTGSTVTELSAQNSSSVSGSRSVSSGTALNFTYYATEARKDYVTAEARLDHDNATYTTATATSDRGYEGVFRSVVVLWQDYDEGSRGGNRLPMLVEGSATKNGTPGIPGFPVQDAQEKGDKRFIKHFYRMPNTAGLTNGDRRFYWVSTEIVSEWLFLLYGSGGTHQSNGEVNNYLTAGYGDLTFGYCVRTY